MARSASRSGGEEEEEERSLGWWVARIRVDDDVDHSIAGETTWPKWAETHSLLWTSPGRVQLGNHVLPLPPSS